MRISEEEINSLLELHPIEDRDLIRKQMNIMTDVINNNLEKYINSLDYREAIDSIFMLVMKGEMK